MDREAIFTARKESFSSWKNVPDQYAIKTLMKEDILSVYIGLTGPIHGSPIKLCWYNQTRMMDRQDVLTARKVSIPSWKNALDQYDIKKPFDGRGYFIGVYLTRGTNPR